MTTTSQNERTIIITGGTGGIGFHSALGIARSGARVVITGRNKDSGEAAKKRIIDETGNEHVELVIGDVSSIAAIDALAAELLKHVKCVDVLVNNVGYLGNEYKKSVDQIEMHFAVNVLAPWRLTLALLPALKKGNKARVLNITGGDAPAAVDINNLQAEKGFRGLMTMTHSKSIMESMSVAMSERLQPDGVTVNVIFPGRASTAMTRSLSAKGLPGGMKIMMPFFRCFFKEDGGKSAAKAAKSTIWGATSSELDGVTGRYFDTHSKEKKLHLTAYKSEVKTGILALIESSPSLKYA